MTNLKGNFNGFANQAGIYRVWVPLHDDGQAPLISIWIDPRMTDFKSQAQEEPLANSGVGEDVAEEIEDLKRRRKKSSAQQLRMTICEIRYEESGM